MTWVGSFRSLESVVRKPDFTNAPLELHTWVRSESGLISPLVDWLMGLIAGSRCVGGKEDFVERALREALSNAMLHGNRTDARKLVHDRCCCESGKGVSGEERRSTCERNPDMNKKPARGGPATQLHEGLLADPGRECVLSSCVGEHALELCNRP